MSSAMHWLGRTHGQLCRQRRQALTLAVWIGMLIGMYSTLAKAQLWGYVDAAGVVHVAKHQVDARYALFSKSKGAGTEDTLIQPAESPKTAEAAPEREPPQTSKWALFFEVSPGFMAVRHHLREAAQAHNLEMELLQALIYAESRFDRFAVSRKGAVGLMQVMPSTAQRYGLRPSATASLREQLTDPRTNIMAGSRYLRDLLNLFSGNLELALAAYNAGEGAVQRYGKQIPPFKETQNYVAVVMNMYQQIRPSVDARQRLSSQAKPDRVRMASEAPPVGAIAGRSNMPSTLPPRLVPANGGCDEHEKC